MAIGLNQRAHDELSFISSLPSIKIGITTINMTQLECWVLFSLLLVTFHLTAALPDVDCKCEQPIHIRIKDPNYRVQECNEKCINDQKNSQDSLGEVIKEVNSLRVMVISLLTLVVLFIILFMIILVTNTKLKKVMAKFYNKITNKDSEPSNTGETHLQLEKGPQINSYAINSPDLEGEGPQLTSSIRIEHQRRGEHRKEISNSKRKRMPSESISPENSQVQATGYDNLALSTSTINYHSRPSSPTSQGDFTLSSDNTRTSMATLNTTIV